MISATEGTWAYYLKKTLRAAPCLLACALALFLAESAWAQAVTYSGASVGANGTIYGWGVTDAYNPSMYHTAYVSTWLTSPHGRSAVVYNVEAPTWVRADLSLPWDANDLGFYPVSSVHWFWCDVGSSFVPAPDSEGGTRVYDFTVTILPTEIRPQGTGGTFQTTVTVQMTPAPYEARAVSLQDVRLNGAAYGGHESNHPTTFPAGTGGTFSPASGNTSSSTGKFTSTYTARIFAGEHQIKATFDGRTKTAPINLRVKVSGLQQLIDGQYFNLIGSTNNHISPNNHYGTSTANTGLVAIANQYAGEFQQSILQFNDQSLPWGGLFDIGPTPGCPACVFWQPDHVSHRLGTDCDIDKTAVPAERRDRVRQIIVLNGATVPEENSVHWHARW